MTSFVLMVGEVYFLHFDFGLDQGLKKRLSPLYLTYWLEQLVRPHSLEALPLYTLRPVFHFQKCLIVMRAYFPGLPLRGRADLSLNTGILLLEITCPKYIKGLVEWKKHGQLSQKNFGCHFCHLTSL